MIPHPLTTNNEQKTRYTLFSFAYKNAVDHPADMYDTVMNFYLEDFDYVIWYFYGIDYPV